MKCPHCGHWNKATFPRCFKCGAPLKQDTGKQDSPWRGQFMAPQRKTGRVVYDETMEPVEDLVQPLTDEERAEKESLAVEMARLRDRRERGTAYLETLRNPPAEENDAPAPAGVSIRRGGFFDETPEAEAAEAQPDAAPDVPRIRRRRAPRGEVSRSYPPPQDVYEEMDDDLPPPLDAPGYIAPPRKKRRAHRVRGPILLAYGLVGLLVVGAAGLGIYALASQVIPDLITQRASTEKLDNVFIDPITMSDGLSGHRIQITGEEGSQIYIAELLKTYVVVNGMATIEVADHVFYDTIDPLEIATMEVSLTPTLVSSGRDVRMENIRYSIDIPQTDIAITKPEADWISVNTATYNMSMVVKPNSKVYINGEDKSDTVDADGVVNYTAPIQAIGDNVITILARAPYCRDRTEKVTIYRAPMEIPLELDAATLSYVSTEDLTILATTDPEATITVETPTFWVDTEDLKENNGAFSLSAKMTRVGNNTITIRASIPGKADSVVEHVVYYLPPADTYTPKAWALGAQDYSELMNNIAMRIEKAQIYLCRGTITRLLSSNPQLAIMNTGTEDSERLVLLENATRDGTVWEIGKVYRVYADVNGVYNNMPRLIGRYSYIVQEEPAEATQAPQADAEEP